MRAVVIERFGGTDVLQVAEVPDPQAGPGQVRIAVHAAGTNPVDASNRDDGSWAGLDLPHVPPGSGADDVVLDQPRGQLPA